MSAATSPVVPLPAKGSSTVSPVRVVGRSICRTRTFGHIAMRSIRRRLWVDSPYGIYVAVYIVSGPADVCQTDPAIRSIAFARARSRWHVNGVRSK